MRKVSVYFKTSDHVLMCKISRCFHVLQTRGAFLLPSTCLQSLFQVKNCQN